MIVTIINQTAPVGQVRVDEFREADSEAVAVADFCNEYNPPKNPLNFLGYDSGWSSYQPPASGFFWAYDFGAPGLVQVGNADSFNWRGFYNVIDTPIVVPNTTPNAWVDVAEMSCDMSFVDADVAMLRFRVWGRYKASSPGVDLPQMRLMGGSLELSGAADIALDADWANLTLIANTPPEAGRKLYKLQVKLRDAAALVEMQSVGFVMLLKKL
jgi:hypothetical protein